MEKYRVYGPGEGRRKITAESPEEAYRKFLKLEPKVPAREVWVNWGFFGTAVFRDHLELSAEEKRKGEEERPKKADSHGSEPRYPALRIIATVYRVLAVFFGIAGVIGLVIGIAEGEMGIILSGVVGGPLGVITSLAAAEGIIVFLDIEENTRRANEK